MSCGKRQLSVFRRGARYFTAHLSHYIARKKVKFEGKRCSESMITYSMLSSGFLLALATRKCPSECGLIRIFLFTTKNEVWFIREYKMRIVHGVIINRVKKITS